MRNIVRKYKIELLLILSFMPFILLGTFSFGVIAFVISLFIYLFVLNKFKPLQDQLLTVALLFFVIALLLIVFNETTFSNYIVFSVFILVLTYALPYVKSIK